MSTAEQPAPGLPDQVITFLAPAKVNLALDVLGKRPDGYHELAMLMQSIGLYDTLRLRRTERPGISLALETADTSLYAPLRAPGGLWHAFAPPCPAFVY